MEKLKTYFPMIYEREELLVRIRSRQRLTTLFESWTTPQQEEFLDFCTGVRGEKQKKFNYKDIKTVYTIVLFESSPREFHKFPNDYLHYFEQCSNTGLKLELLQK